MKIYSKFKKGLVFEVHNSINKDSIKKLLEDVNAYEINVFQTLDWIYSSDEILKNNSIYLIIGRLNGKISYFLPIKKFFKFTDILYTYVNPLFSDYSLPYISKNIKLKNLKEYRLIIQESLKTICSPKFLFLRNQKDIFNFLSNKIPFGTYYYTNSYFLNFDKFELASSLNKKLKYYKKRISKEYPDYVILDYCKKINNKKPFDKDIEKIIELKNKQFLRTKTTKIIKSELWKNISSFKSSELSIYVSLIKINSIIVSGVICLLHNKIIFYLIPVYDNNFKKYSLGIFHLNHIINFAKENKLKGVDLTIGDEPYKLKFHTDKFKIFSSFYANKNYLKPILFFMIFSYKLLNKKILKFIFSKLKITNI